MWSFLTTLGGVKWLLFIAVCLIALAVISSNWHPGPAPKPPQTWTRDVVSVTNGATIVVKAGVLERRTALVTLADVAAPYDGLMAEESRRNLELMAGGTIKVQGHRGALGAEEVEGWRDVVGVVWGETGLCLNTEQIRMGLARNTGTQKAWVAAEAEAKKNKRGLWAR